MNLVQWLNLFQVPDKIDIFYAILTLLIFSGLFIVRLWLRKASNLYWEITRGIIEVAFGLIAAISPFIISRPFVLIIFAIGFIIFHSLLIHNGLLSGNVGNNKSYGSIYFSISYIILIFLYWNTRPALITCGILLFTFPDAIATLLDKLMVNAHRYQIINETRSLETSVSILLAGFLVLLGIFCLFPDAFNFRIPFWVAAIMIALVASVIANLSTKRSDHLFIPLGSTIFCQILLLANPEQMTQLYIGFLASILIVVPSYFSKFLDLSGSLMSFILGIVIFGLGGLQWTIPILIFFILSSLLSKTGQGIKQKFANTFEKSGMRDYSQVLANGGIGGIFVLVNIYNPSEMWYEIYILSLAIAAADTWATEIGVLFKPKPVLITTFKKVEPGISGAISFHGTFGALMGSGINASGIFLFNHSDLNQFLLITGFGFLGSVIDSILGATIQGQYRCNECGKYTERKNHCSGSTILISGYSAINNDFINLGSNLITIGLYLVII